MIRKSSRFLTQLYVLVDAACMMAMLFAAFWIKFDSGWLPSADTLPFKTYFFRSLVYVFVAILIGFYVGFYMPRRRKSLASDLWKIVQVQSISFMLLAGLLYATKEIHISREFLILFYGMNIAVLATYRVALKLFLFRMRRKGYNKKFVLILGAGAVGREFYERLQQFPELGYEVFGFLDDKLRSHPLNYRNLKPIIGNLDDLGVLLRKHPIDEVIIALPLGAYHKYASIISVCDNAGAKTLIIPDYFELLPARPYFDNFAGIPIINVRDVPLDEFSNRLLKRAFDFVFSTLALIVVSPIMLLAAIGIKLTSPGPIIFVQERMGLDRRTFQMYKFRTMTVSDLRTTDTEWTSEQDERITWFGKLLRRTSIDELPQFFNVLIGDMSVVGPRPERPFFVEQFKDEIPKYMVKHHIRPGITGWAQTNGLRGDTSIQDRIVHDLFYIENWSFSFDLRIILKTMFKGFVNRNAY